MVIFCCVAQRLGIDAQPVGFPYHVLAVVIPRQAILTEGGATEDQSHPRPIYLDPFRTGDEVAEQDLVMQLRSLQVPSPEFSEHLGPSRTEEVVHRCAKNIVTSVNALPHRNAASTSTDQTLPDIETSLYAALWSILILPGNGLNEGFMQRNRCLQRLLETMGRQFPLDTSLVEAYLIPTVRNLAQRASIMKMLGAMRSSDNMPRPVQSRDAEAAQKVRYRVGQIFHHKRYQYEAVITGWDVECKANPEWIEQMGVNTTLSRGQHQSFYNVL